MEPGLLLSVLPPSHADDGTVLPDTPTTKNHPSSEASLVAGDLRPEIVEPVNVQMYNLSVEVAGESWGAGIFSKAKQLTGHATSQTRKTLLKSVTANLEPGSLTAIIGASGSGKSTLLDALSGRLTGGCRISAGSVICKGKSAKSEVRIAYATQRDVLLPTLTVRETLHYAAELRLPQPLSPARRCAIVDNVITELGLQKCADTRIGDDHTRGCSGGEKRRVSLGLQLLANPSLLYLDEPTTGLDAASALALTATVRRLCERDRVVVMTVHQPRPEIWSLFDNAILLAQGSPLFSGPVRDALPWFEALGFTRPMFVNPADFLIDISAIDHRSGELERESKERIAVMRDAWHSELPPQHSQFTTASWYGQQDREWKQGSQCATFWRQLQVLTHRTVKITCRDPLGITACFIEAILMGLAVGYIFYDTGRDQAGIKSREGCLYVAASLQGYLLIIFETYRVTFDMSTFDRERSDGYVQPAAFLLSRRLAKLPLEDLPVPAIFSALIYFMAGLDREPSKVAIFFAISLLNHYLAVMCATLCVVISRDFPTASLIASLIYTLQSLASGFIIQVDSMPVYIRWTRWITYSFYTFSAYIGNEFEDNFYDCPFNGGVQNAACVQYQGNFVIKTLGFPLNWTGRAIACMGGFIMLFLLLCITGLHFPTPLTSSEPRLQSSGEPVEFCEEDVDHHSRGQVQPIVVKLHQYGLSLRLRRMKTFWRGYSYRTIIQSNSATFEPGMLNIILGASGCGKTTLLNSVCHRLQPTYLAQYVQQGKITFNDLETSADELRAHYAYATQHSEALLPALTVRETLIYAAALRLSGLLTPAERVARVADLICSLGLRGCADTLVGSNAVRGISGGEKRRLALAVQILNDPKVLLVDEPTSGLDAFTANSIMKLLYEIAKEGRTVIVAIHQPRSDLFAYFGNILLLSEGGHTIYSGLARNMITYFAEAGHECPPQMNPADFALDLTTVSQKSLVLSNQDRVRVNRLVHLWRDNELGVARLREQFCEVRQLNNKSLQFRGRDSSFYSQVLHLLCRATTNTIRQPQLVVARIMQSSGVAIIFTIFFAPLGHDYSSIQNRFGLFQQLGGFYIIGMLTNAAVYPFERDNAYNEIQDRIYTVDAFLASYTILELPFEILNSLFLGLLLVFAIGLPRTAPSFFVASLAGFSGLSCGESLGIMFNTVFSHTGFAMNLMGVLLAVANAMAGILSLDMPDLFNIFNYLSPIRYQVRGVAYYSLIDQFFECDQDSNCPLRTGQEALALYNFDGNPKFNIVGMVLCAVIYRVVAWLLLRILRQVRTS